MSSKPRVKIKWNIRNTSINAAKSIALSIETLLGPFGAAKISLSDVNEEAWIFDALSALDALNIHNAVGQLIRDIAHTHKEVVGTGVATFVVLFGRLCGLIGDSIRIGVPLHPALDALDIVGEMLIDICNRIAIRIILPEVSTGSENNDDFGWFFEDSDPDPQDRNAMAQYIDFLTQTTAHKQENPYIDTSIRDIVATIVLELIKNGGVKRLSSTNPFHITTKSTLKSFRKVFYSSVVVPVYKRYGIRKDDHDHYIARLLRSLPSEQVLTTNILVIDGALEPPIMKDKVLISQPSELASHYESRSDWEEKLKANILYSNVRLIVVSGSVTERIFEWAENNRICILSNTTQSITDRISKLMKTRIIPSEIIVNNTIRNLPFGDQANVSFCGYGNSSSRMGGREDAEPALFVIISNSSNSSSNSSPISVLIFEPTCAEVNRSKKMILNSYCRVKNALLTKKVLPGSGLLEMYLSMSLRAKMKENSSNIYLPTIMEKFAESLDYIATTTLQNAGYSLEEAISQVFSERQNSPSSATEGRNPLDYMSLESVSGMNIYDAVKFLGTWRPNGVVFDDFLGRTEGIRRAIELCKLVMVTDCLIMNPISN